MNRVVIGLAVTFVVLIGLAAFVPVQTTLVVTDTETGEEIIEEEVTDGDLVQLEYTHSVERTPITEEYEISGTKLAENKIVFRSYGAGLPTTTNMTTTDEGFVVHSEDTYNSLTVALHPVPNHTLTVNGQQYYLLNRSDGPVAIDIEEQSLIEVVAVTSTGCCGIGHGIFSGNQKQI